MFYKEQVEVRQDWKEDVKTSGFPVSQWSEGSMTVVRESPADLAEVIGSYSSEVRHALNGLFKVCEPLEESGFPNLSADEALNAAANSWAHQDMCLPIRFDIAVLKTGGYSLLAAKGDYLEGMTGAAEVTKSWYKHHFESSPGILEVNFLPEHLSSVLHPYGRHSSPPSIKDVTILSGSEAWSSAYFAKCLGEGPGLELSSVGCSGLGSLSEVDLASEPLSSAVIKVTPWKEILQEAEEGSPWIELFKNGARKFVLQPAWVWALDEMLDFNEHIPDDEIDFVVNVWVSIFSAEPIPLLVSSEYKPGYKFEDSMITPLVLNLKEPAAE